MPKIPRDISGKKLTVLLKKYGYVIVRSTGSHIRLKSNYADIEHNITIPSHNPLKIVLQGLSNPSKRDLIALKVKTWFPNRSKWREHIYESMDEWTPEVDVIIIFGMVYLMKNHKIK